MIVLDEAQLVKAVARGDQTALGELLDAYQQRIYNVCLRMVSNRDDAAEVAQEAIGGAGRLVQLVGVALGLHHGVVGVALHVGGLDGVARDARDPFLIPGQVGEVFHEDVLGPREE